MGILKKTEWTERKIQEILIRNFLSPNSKKYEVTGLYVYDWESDYLAITKSNYVYECEVKISRSDFFADQKKQRKHLILEGKNFALKTNGEYPNYFYYAVPEGLISKEEVPDYAGLIYCKPYEIEIVKQAPKISKEPANFDNLKLIDKFYWNMVTWKSKAEGSEIQNLKQKVKELEKNCLEYDQMLSEANVKIDELNSQLQKYENGNNFIQQTPEEKYKMYMKCKKSELARMLVARDMLEPTAFGIKMPEQEKNCVEETSQSFCDSSDNF